MPRRLKRYTGRGDLHFITFSCYERRAFLQSKRAKNLFVKILSEVRTRHRFRLVGYVVMPERRDEDGGVKPPLREKAATGDGDVKSRYVATRDDDGGVKPPLREQC